MQQCPFINTSVIKLLVHGFIHILYYKYMYAELEKNVNCQIFILPKRLRKYAEWRVQLPMQQYSI